MPLPPNQPPDTPKLHKEGVPEGLWMRCPACESMIYKKVVGAGAYVSFSGMTAMDAAILVGP